ncbi:MAG: DUF1491 family protein [Alphaproteobacteria bacterium]|nr:DUF1491 family protein [Alphaproteobacteria bacterium]
MIDDRLRTELWVMSHVRQCTAAGVPATVAHRGEANSGTLLLKINQFDRGCRVLSQTRDLDGNMGWLAAFDDGLVPEAEADDYIERAVSRDPDLWVLEIEHRDGWHPFEGNVF